LISHAAEDYLAQIFRIQSERGSAATQDVAVRRHVTSASTTAMFKRLAREGLVAYREYEGVSLTEQGEQIALAVLRRHRIVERFLTDVLGIPWQDVDDLADRMEHAVPDEVVDALERLLGGPETCPHGFPIPDKAGRFAPPSRRLLADGASGERLRISRVDERVPGLLRHVEEIGLQPGTEVTVVERGDFDETLTLSVGRRQMVIGPRVSRSLFVVAADEGPERG
jgi:DtxR family Mn-dependent transcriptional regulator